MDGRRARQADLVGGAHDANDNTLVGLDPAYGGSSFVAGARTTSEYDAMDRQTALVAPAHGGPAPRSEWSYDAAGRLVKQTRPLGVATPAVANDYATALEYDLLDRLTRQTSYPADGAAAGARITSLCYDLAGDLRSVTAPKGAAGFTGCPAAVHPDSYTPSAAASTRKLEYTAAHELRRETDVNGNASELAFDTNGNAETLTDEAGTVGARLYDQRDRLVRSEQPFDPARPARKLVTKLEYDPAGNLVREISPRAVDTHGEAGPYTSYVTTHVYDELDRELRTLLPTDGSTPQAYLHRAYEPNGSLAWSSLAVETADPAAVLVEQRYQLFSFDTGWISGSDDPGKGRVDFDYTAQGWQAARRPAGGPEESWSYFDDGLLREQKDPRGHLTAHSYDLDGNLTRSDDTAGPDRPGQEKLELETDYNGFDEPIQLRQRKRPPGQTAPAWQLTELAYDLNGNLAQRIDAGRVNDFGYDAADRLVTHRDQGQAGCGDDLQVTTAYLATGWEQSRILRRSEGGCDPALWPIRQQSLQSYFQNGDLKTLQTWKGTQSSANLLEEHTLALRAGGRLPERQPP